MNQYFLFTFLKKKLSYYHYNYLLYSDRVKKLIVNDE